MIKNIGIDGFRLRDYGIGTYLQNTINHLKNADESLRFFIFCNPDDVDFLDELNPGVVPVPRANFLYSPYNMFNLSRSLKKYNINLFHSVHYVAPLGHKLPIVLTLHDMLPFEFPQSIENVSRRTAFKKVQKTIDKASKIIAVSRSTKSDVLKHFRIDPDKITVIHNGVDARFFDKIDLRKTRNFRERYQLHFPFILYAGNVRPHKNITRIIECMEILNEPPFDELRFVIAGYDISKNKSLRGMISKKGLSDRIRILGYIDKVIYLYKLASIFINPSLYEGFGVSALEAMAVGTPVIVSNKSALPEIAGDAALLVDPYNTNEFADAIKRIMKEQKLRNSLIKKGKERAAEFTWQDSVSKLLKIYYEVLK
jgi:glycosyltransferase involved in cell wall biosynthesis